MDALLECCLNGWRRSSTAIIQGFESNIEQVLATTPHQAPTLSHLPLVTKTIQARRIRHAGHCWRRKDELVSDVLLWTPAYGQSKAGRPARTYIQQLCDDTGCNPEGLPEAMNDRETWRKRVRDISVLAAGHDDDDCYTYYEMTDKFLWFQVQMNSYSRNWNTPYYSLIVNAGEFQKCNMDETTL